MIYFSRYNVEHRKYYICKIHLREYMIPGTIPLDSHFFLKKPMHFINLISLEVRKSSLVLQ